jgi:hypothetical protein
VALALRTIASGAPFERVKRLAEISHA